MGIASFYFILPRLLVLCLIVLFIQYFYRSYFFLDSFDNYIKSLVHNFVAHIMDEVNYKFRQIMVDGLMYQLDRGDHQSVPTSMPDNMSQGYKCAPQNKQNYQFSSSTSLDQRCVSSRSHHNNCPQPIDVSNNAFNLYLKSPTLNTFKKSIILDRKVIDKYNVSIYTVIRVWTFLAEWYNILPFHFYLLKPIFIYLPTKCWVSYF